MNGEPGGPELSIDNRNIHTINFLNGRSLAKIGMH